MLYWIVAAIIFPVPIFHLWLHALLPFWRKHPFLFYFLCGAFWAGVFAVMRSVDAFLPTALFEPPPRVAVLGLIFMGLGGLAVFFSIWALSPKKFFMWAVLRPGSTDNIRVDRWLFRLFPHPAYLGYIVAGLGNFLACGKLYLLGIFIFAVSLTPIVIWLEERELGRRAGIRN